MINCGGTLVYLLIKRSLVEIMLFWNSGILIKRIKD